MRDGGVLLHLGMICSCRYTFLGKGVRMGGGCWVVGSRRLYV